LPVRARLAVACRIWSDRTLPPDLPPMLLQAGGSEMLSADAER
jgi:hypothetical protein